MPSNGEPLLNVLFVGDIIGRPARKAVAKHLPGLMAEHDVSFCVANAENAAGGKGLTRKVAAELYDAGVDVLTLGNHAWANKEIFDFIDEDDRVVRPENFPPGAPGRGFGVYTSSTGIRVAVLQLQGRVFMDAIDCPFRAADRVLEREALPPVRIVDFHADATSEKSALGWHLDGRVSAVIGTHTHVPTADERLLPGGTAYVTDVGMVGSFDSIIGVEAEPVVYRFITKMPRRHTVVAGGIRLCGAVITIDPETGRPASIRRITVPEFDSGSDQPRT
jgi:metallophosphoesterase (TIGR00282 family)